MSFKKHSAKLLSKLGQTRIPSDVTAEAVLRFFEALDCPKSLAASILYKYGEHEQLLDLSCNPLDYNSSLGYKDAYLTVKFLSRSSFLKTSYDRKQLAVDKFLKFEDLCKQTNSRFRSNDFVFDESSTNGALLSAMRRKISQILGEFSASELFDSASWGPGVSTLIKGEETFAAKKFQCETGITRDLYPLVRDLFPLAYPGWWDLLASRCYEDNSFPTFQKGNKVVTVPKTSKIDRVIAIEPGLNLWFQLGLGEMISRRLRRFGVDVRDQTRNQRLAKEGSISNSLATVDFSSASDSISAGLVYSLFNFLPVKENFEPTLPVWYTVMDSCRSKYGMIGSQTFRWEKFSSMGNGFTFPLESLIFFSAALVCCESLRVSTKEVSVYGDDVIIPSTAFSLFSSFCSFLGFTINPAKSFSSGSFRESCGEHYFRGVSCKPVFFEKALTKPQEVYNFANTIRLRSHDGFCCDSRFRSIFYWLQTKVPKLIRFKVPCQQNSHSGSVEPTDGGFISNLDESGPSRSKSWIEGFRFRRLAWVAVSLQVDYFGVLLARLHSPLVTDKGGGNSLPLRGRTRCHFVVTSIRRWYDLGPWL